MFVVIACSDGIKIIYSRNMQKTLVLIKPDGIRRGLAGEIISRLEKRCYTIVECKMFHVTPEFARVHYAEHSSQVWFEPLCDFLAGGKLMALVIEGLGAISGVRALVGNYGTPGTIRGDFANVNVMRENVVHASDGEIAAKNEIGLWFQEKAEVCQHGRMLKRKPPICVDCGFSKGIY